MVVKQKDLRRLFWTNGDGGFTFLRKCHIYKSNQMASDGMLSAHRRNWKKLLHV